MPTTRTRVERRRSDSLNANQESILRCGSELFPGWDGFDDEEHAHEAWETNRERLMSEHARPGRRPWPYWAFDLSLEEARDAHGHLTFAWPPPIQSEAEMVYDLLKLGKLKSCQFNGTHRIESELRAIRENWLTEIRIAMGGKSHVPKITTAMPTWGTPVWFYQEHAPRMLSEALADRAKWRAKRERQTGQHERLEK
jgi:hypothetical protein